jgi:site-specific DNA recombinase
MLIQCNTIEQYHPLRAALYARVSSEQQAQAGTIDSQIAAILTRAAEETVSIEPELRFVDDGHSGATLVRPALERLRDQAAAGAIDRLYVLCPDRLARSYAYQMLLVDELQKCGVELLFLNHPLGKTPEDNLLLQVQGMVAEYERAKIIERGRRGKLHAARQGRVNVMGKAPYGYRYLPASGGETARYQVEFAQASVVQEIFQWVAHERLSLKQACKRLEKQGVLSPSGKGRWNTSTLLGMLRNPAYKGLAAFGRRRNGPPIRPRLRVRRNGHEHPRNGQGSYRTPSQEWISIPVPSIVDEALFEAVSEQLAQNRQRHRQGQRPIRHLLAQLLVCKCCGYAYGGRYNGGAARKCKYSYYRCAGTEAHRFGGQKVCENKSLRQDLLDAAVWNDVRSLLSDPARVQEELQRRIAGDQPDAQEQAHTKLSGQIEKVRRAIARLIDAYGEGLMEKSEFEPRIKSARTQLAQWQEQLQQQIDQQTRAREMRLLIDNLQTFSRQVASGLENADWATRRQIITTLVKRVEIEPKCASKAGEVSRMKESHDQGLAHPIDPESCAAAREGVGEALTGADAGRPCTVPKAFTVPDADAHVGARKATPVDSPWQESAGSGGAAEPAHASKHLARTPAVAASSARRPPSGRRVTEAGRSHARPRSVNRGPHRQSLTREHRDDERA